MNSQLKIFITTLLILGFSLIASAGILDKGFEALNVHDYFKAKSIFYKSLKKQPAAAAFGLSVIYSRNNNPFYNLDSALFYAKKASINYYTNTTNKQKIKNKTLGVDTVSIRLQRKNVDEKCFLFAKKQNTVNAYNYFIKQNNGALKLNKAIENRNELAYQNARKINSSIAYKMFMDTYPDAEQVDEVNARYQQRLYKEYTVKGNVESFEKFITEQPNNFYVTEAQKKIYQLATQNKTLKEYASFIRKYPKNTSVNKAWRNVYAIETRINSSESIKNFLIKYPKYPFKDELKQNYILANTIYYPIKKNNKWGFVNKKLDQVIAPIYSWVSDFYEGAAVAELKGKFGFIDKKNEVLISFEYDEAEPFLNGLSVVGKNDKYGIINKIGEIIVPLMYDDIGSTKNEFIAVELDGKFGFIDRKGTLKVGLKYETVSDFNNGIAYVKQNGFFGIIDTNLMYVAKPKYQWIDNLNNRFIRVQVNDSFGVVNTKGDYIVAPVYNQITELENGFALVVKEDKYGYLNANGDLVIPIDFNYVEGVLNWAEFNKKGYARVIVENKFGLIDTLGKRFIPALFEDVGAVSADLIAIKRHGKWGYCDYSAKLKIPYNFDYATKFVNEYAIVQNDNNWGVINKKGTFVIAPDFEELTWFKGKLMFKKEGLYGIMNLDKEEILGNRYVKIEQSKDKKFLKLFSANGFEYKP
ncbi:MAG: WG repeat-containing protein [Vicingaceae bacterium]